MSDVDVVVHLASAPYQGRYTAEVDVEGTRRLLSAARAAGVRHLLYVSIVGVDRVPWGFFRHKLAAEQLLRDSSGVGWSILRATQFHDFLDSVLRAASWSPILISDAGIVAQPVDPREVDRIAALVSTGPSHAVAEFGGPEVLHADDIVGQWLDARQVRRPLFRLPLPGRLGRAFRAGHLTTGVQPAGDITWENYLVETHGRAAPTERKRQRIVWFERHLQNPPVRAALRAGVPLPGLALLETTGRKSGEPRHTPVGNGLHGDRFWIVAEHGRRAQYVRNLEVDPRARQDRPQMAHRNRPDPRRRRPAGTRPLDGRHTRPLHKADAAIARATATTPLNVRVDLDEFPGPRCST